MKTTCLLMSNFLLTRLLGRPSSISTFNCGFISEFLLFVQYKTKTKKVCGFHNIFCAISKFFKIKKLLSTKILIIHKPSLGSLDAPQKIWARSVQPFWRLLDTNRQTDRHAKFIYRLNTPETSSCACLEWRLFLGSAPRRT